MSKYSIKRKKALLGGDGAVMAAATLAAAGMTTAATAIAADKQAKSVIDSAKSQANAIKLQSDNNTQLQKESINFTREQNEENRQQQQDIQTTLQMLAGRQNANDRYEANKMQVKYGGKPKIKNKRRSIKKHIDNINNNDLFKVTDGGGVLPINVTPEGYGLYEIIGNDHEHYHRASGGKNKTGVGIKFNDGSVVEGEGNQNTNQGELMYITPDDAMFISKHSIDGFNPTKAVINGVHPQEAFNVQEYLKTINGYKDDGTKAKCGKRKSMKKVMGGYNPVIEQANVTQNIGNNTGAISGGVAYLVNNANIPLEGINNKNTLKKEGRISLKCGGRAKAAKGYWNNYAGATYNAAGNVLGAGLTTWGNMWAAGRLGNAYNKAGNILAEAYSNMKGIDMSEIKRENYEAPHAMAVVRSANTNINPQLERIRRNTDAERREINRGTISSAARQQRLSAANDRMLQRVGEQYANKQNIDEQIKQGNAERITQVAQENANRDVQALKDYTGARLAMLQYNNDIANTRIMGAANARADAMTQSVGISAQALQNSMNAIGSAVSNSGKGFSSAFEARRAEDINDRNTYIGASDADKVKFASLKYEQDGDDSYIKSAGAAFAKRTDKEGMEFYDTIAKIAKENNITIPPRETNITSKKVNLNSNIITDKINYFKDPKTAIALNELGIPILDTTPFAVNENLYTLYTNPYSLRNRLINR